MLGASGRKLIFPAIVRLSILQCNTINTVFAAEERNLNITMVATHAYLDAHYDGNDVDLLYRSCKIQTLAILASICGQHHLEAPKE